MINATPEKDFRLSTFAPLKTRVRLAPGERETLAMLTAEHPSFFDEILSQFFEHQSLEESIQLLATCLKRHIPFSKLTCYVSDVTKKKHYPLVVYDTTGVLTDLAPRFLNNPPLEWVQEHIVDEEFSIFIEHDCQHGGVGFHNVFAERSSLLAMTLFTSEYYFISMTLTSPLPHQFTKEHAQLLKMLHHPLAKLTHGFFKSQPDVPLILSGEFQAKLSSLDLLKRCRGLRQPVRLLEGVAPTDYMVLLQGETGVGKELFADALHMLSSRKDSPFIRVNCAAITPSLMDDAFFGHEKGAFTGAATTHLGYFEQANGGTLFLDEIGELSPSGQARLLRVLESQELVRVGGQRRIMINVRLVAATHRDLEAMVRQGTFREDLWYRLSVFPIAIPPLRQRKEDLPVLARWFHTIAVKQFDRQPVPVITEDYIASLLHQTWPGNVRQLRHHIEQSIIRANIAGSHTMKPLPMQGEGDAEPFRQTPLSMEQEESERAAEQNPPLNPLSKTRETLESINARHILQILDQCKGRIQGPFGAAAALGVNASTLRSRMKKLGINRGRHGQETH